jgi:hypothetical protein
MISAWWIQKDVKASIRLLIWDISLAGIYSNLDAFESQRKFVYYEIQLR